jgi:DRTGG domain
MKIRDVVDILTGRILVENHGLDEEVPRGGAADLMSDVLAFGSEGMVLMTGLTNPQVVRTAEMAGINVIVIVRDKTPPPETLELARESGITVINTGYTMYEACGRLFKEGLPGLGQVKIQDDSW